MCASESRAPTSAGARWQRIALLAVLVVSAHTVPARSDAKVDDKAEAARLFEEGRALVKQERFVEACARFAESYKLEKAVGTALNLADCFERQGQLDSAWHLFDAAARDPEATPPKVKYARDRADALAGKLATLIITIHDPSPKLRVTLAGHDVPPAREIRDVVEPSDVEVVVELPGSPPFRKLVHATAGSVSSVDVPSLAPVAIAPPPGPGPSEATESRRQRSRVYLAGGIAGAGAVALGISLGFAIDAKSTYDSAFEHGCVKTAAGNMCDTPGQKLIEDAGSEADVATGFVIGGAVLVGAAAVIYMTAPRETVVLHPVVTAHEIGLGVEARW